MTSSNTDLCAPTPTTTGMTSQLLSPPSQQSTASKPRLSLDPSSNSKMPKRKDSADISDEEPDQSKSSSKTLLGPGSAAETRPGAAGSPTPDEKTELSLQHDDSREESKASNQSRDPHHVYLSSVLLKHRLGFSQMYLRVFCKATWTSFQYYKRDCKCWLNAPLMNIPYKCILECRKIAGHIHGFELVPRPTWSLGMARTAVAPKPKMKPPMNTANRTRPKTKFNVKMPGHLMLRPMLYDEYLAQRKSVEEDKAEKEPQKAQEQYKVNEVEFDCMDEAAEYQRFLAAAISKSTVVPMVKETEKIFKGTNSGWVSRELDWYMAEELLVFVARDEEDRERWVTLLNWLIAKHRDEQCG